MLISDFLLTGEQNAQTAKEICNHARCIGWKLTERQLSKTIETELRRGVPICASCDSKSPGYYIAADKGEMQLEISLLLANAKALAVASLSHRATTAEAHAAFTSIYTDTDLHRRRRKPIIPQEVQEPMTRTKATAEPQKAPLSLDAAAAARMGLSYGKYKAIQYFPSELCRMW